MKNKTGLTLIEVVVSIAVIAIIMYAAIAVFINSGAKSVNVEIFTIAQSLAEGKLEEVMAKDFESINSQDETKYSGDLNAYSYQIIVDYVSNEDLDIPVEYAKDYKKIIVLINQSQLKNPVKLESIRTSY